MAHYEVHPFANADDPFPLEILVPDEGEKMFTGEEAERTFLEARLDVEMEVTASILDESGNYVGFVAYHGNKGHVARQLRLAVETASETRGQRVSSRISWVLLKGL
jgi:hypothetical protein